MPGIKWATCLLRQDAEQLDKGHHWLIEPLNTQGPYAIGSFLPAPLKLFCWRTKPFCLRLSTFYGAFNDPSVKVGVAVFCFRGWSELPEAPLPFLLFIIGAEGEGPGRWAHVGFCVSSLTLQHKWEEAYGLPGISWGWKEDIWGVYFGTGRQQDHVCRCDGRGEQPVSFGTPKSRVQPTSFQSILKIKKHLSRSVGNCGVQDSTTAYIWRAVVCYISGEGWDRLAASPFSGRLAAGKERALLRVRSVYLVITVEKRP